MDMTEESSPRRAKPRTRPIGLRRLAAIIAAAAAAAAAANAANAQESDPAGGDPLHFGISRVPAVELVPYTPTSMDAPSGPPGRRFSGIHPAAPASGPAYGDAPEADRLWSTRRNGLLSLGGEINLDGYYRRYDAAPAMDGRYNLFEYQATTANLRIAAEAAETVRLHIKLDFSEGDRAGADKRTAEAIVEECRFALENIYGTGLSLVFGKGEVPYGQDRTLGIIQSYHHNADRAASSEGPILILHHDDDPAFSAPGGYAHPGEIDRVMMGALGYGWGDCLRLEGALFQRDRSVWRRQASDGPLGGMAARLWWRPIESWMFEISALRLQSRAAGDPGNRCDLTNPDNARDASYALSLGFDGSGRRWDLFGEWEHGWDWNHSRGAHTDTFQLGGAWRFTERWRAGLMAEWLRRRDPNANDAREDWRRLVANVKYRWDSGMYAMLEYGHEWFTGRYASQSDKVGVQGDLLAFRFGWMF